MQSKGNQTMSQLVLTPDLFALIDEAGSIDAEVKRLTKQLDTLKARIKACGMGDHSGFVFNAKVIESERITTDWQTIASRFNPSTQLITAHTTHSIVQSIRFNKA
jgi:hypothetical protein